jgi:trypsin-like peptidase
VLTAAHCVRGLSPEHVWVGFIRQEKGTRQVTKIKLHESADLAIVELESLENEVTEGNPEFAFWNFVGNLALGEEFFAYGYPVEPQQERDMLRFTPRVFRGHYQRFFRMHDVPGGYSYRAIELNIPAPEGLSGGPVFRPRAPQMLTGIVTSNIESYTIADSFEEIVSPNQTQRYETRRIISYGAAASLSDVEPWLNENVRFRVGTPWRPG